MRINALPSNALEEGMMGSRHSQPRLAGTPSGSSPTEDPLSKVS